MSTAVISKQECERRFGSNFNPAVKNGVIKGVIVPPKKSDKQTSVVPEWTSGSYIVTKHVKICSISLDADVGGPSVGNAVPVSVEICHVNESCGSKNNGGGRTQAKQRQADSIVVHGSKRTNSIFIIH